MLIRISLSDISLGNMGHIEHPCEFGTTVIDKTCVPVSMSLCLLHIDSTVCLEVCEWCIHIMHLYYSKTDDLCKYIIYYTISHTMGNAAITLLWHSMAAILTFWQVHVHAWYVCRRVCVMTKNPVRQLTIVVTDVLSPFGAVILVTTQQELFYTCITRMCARW